MSLLLVLHVAGHLLIEHIACGIVRQASVRIVAVTVISSAAHGVFADDVMLVLLVILSLDLIVVGWEELLLVTYVWCWDVILVV